MKTLHGDNIYNDPQLQQMLTQWHIKEEFGAISPLQNMTSLREFVVATKPKLFVEVGVFRGATSVAVAKMFDELTESTPQMASSFIISIDSWLMDLEFVWSGISKRKLKKSQRDHFYGHRVAGHQMMYFEFLTNVIKSSVSHRIVPLPSASSNAVYTLLSLALCPDVVYLDASHANPDVYVDLVGLWLVLRPGGLIVCDDYNIPAVHQAVAAFVLYYAATIASHHESMGQYWIDKKR